ncbi:uncharacterized [Tachysurus ichikawai]
MDEEHENISISSTALFLLSATTPFREAPHGRPAQNAIFTPIQRLFNIPPETEPVSRQQNGRTPTISRLISSSTQAHVHTEREGQMAGR